MMTAEFIAAHASGEHWAAISSELAEKLERQGPIAGGLAFLYVSEPIAGDMASMLTFLRSRLGVECWVGTSGVGVCGPGRAYFGVPAASVMIAPLRENSFHVFDPICTDDDIDDDALQDAITRLEPLFGLIHADPGVPEALKLLPELARTGSTYLVGGVASGNDKGAAQIANKVTRGGLSGVLFANDTVVQVGLSQACSPIGPVHRVTEGRGGIISLLDDKPAYQVFCDEMAADENGLSLASGGGTGAQLGTGRYHIAFMVPGTDTGDFVVRNLMGIDPQNNLIAVNDDARPGDAVRFVRRDSVTAEQDLRRMLADLQRRLPGRPRGALYCSCVARGPHLFGTENREMMIIQEELGDLPLTGFYGNGEICNDRFYAYTGVLTLFM
jgi:small ligand-binding sensory domain FIST